MLRRTNIVLVVVALAVLVAAWAILESDPESLFLVSVRSVSRFFSTGTF
jgi:hypothetical protein